MSLSESLETYSHVLFISAQDMVAQKNTVSFLCVHVL